MHKKSDIFIYDIYSIDSLPIKKILYVLRPILINYKIRDKKFMWVNLKKQLPESFRKKIFDLNKKETIFCQRTSLDKPHTILIPKVAANP